MSCQFWIEYDDNAGLYEHCKASGQKTACGSCGNCCECGKFAEEVKPPQMKDS